MQTQGGMKMHVFLTGANGFIGGVVVERLQHSGHTVTGLARNETAAATLQTHGVTPVQGSLQDANTLIRAAREAEAVIHLGFGKGQDAIETDRKAVEAFLVGLASSNKPLIYTSGSMVTGDSGDAVTDESTPLDTKGAASWRGQHEQAALAGTERGVRALVIRPASIVYGRGGGGTILGLLKGARENGAARYVGTGENRKSPVHVEDLANLYVLALERGVAGQVFLGASDEIVTQKAVAEAASRAAGAGGKTVSWSLEEARKAIGFLADIQAMNSVVSSTKARRVLEWNPQGPTLLSEFEHGSYLHPGAAAS